ncbi:hypothetical protein OC842_006194 [Tilletia horrida]|uniref:Uncharacterized protein n=1 Tax=Tilletia horrida TaxID=155126 RepID=A0AAN6G6B9_9BASI|nr:hypothetical protein OC842_006194 [Tilletia horrida]
MCQRVKTQCSASYDWTQLGKNDWVDQACRMYLLRMGSSDMLVIFSLEVGSVKYDPVLSSLRARLIFLSMLLQAAAESLVLAGCPPAAARSRLAAYQPFWDEVDDVKATLKAVQGALFSLRNEAAANTDLSPEEEQERASLVSDKVVQGNSLHLKATGQPWSEERIKQWDGYIASLPQDRDWRHTIMPSSGRIPFPLSVAPASEEHKAWFCSRAQDVDLVRAAVMADAVHRVPFSADTKSGWDEYTATRSRALAARAIDHELNVSPIHAEDAMLRILRQNGTLPVYSMSCSNCGLGYLADHNTQHRCRPDGLLMRITDLHLERRVLLAAFEVADALGIEDGHSLTIHELHQVLQGSNIFGMSRTVAREDHADETAQVEAELEVDEASRPTIHSESTTWSTTACSGSSSSCYA